MLLKRLDIPSQLALCVNYSIVNYGLTLKFPKSNEYNSPEGTRENNTKEMAKKDYESPKMDEVKVNVEQELLTASGGHAECGTYCATDCTSDCSENF